MGLAASASISDAGRGQQRSRRRPALLRPSFAAASEACDTGKDLLHVRHDLRELQRQAGMQDEGAMGEGRRRHQRPAQRSGIGPARPEGPAPASTGAGPDLHSRAKWNTGCDAAREISRLRCGSPLLRSILPLMVCIAMASCGAKDESNGEAAMHDATLAKLKLTSNAFDNGQRIPRQFTCDGGDLRPSLELERTACGNEELCSRYR